MVKQKPELSEQQRLARSQNARKASEVRKANARRARIAGLVDQLTAEGVVVMRWESGAFLAHNMSDYGEEVTHGHMIACTGEPLTQGLAE